MTSIRPLAALAAAPLLRLRASPFAALLLAFGAGAASAQSGAAKQTPQDLIDAFHSAFGVHHARAVHAKGILLEGTFTAAREAQSLSTAPIFSGATLPVVVRFSDFTGLPDIPDTVGDANPRGLAVKIKSPAGEDFDMVTHSFNGFPVANSDEFAVFLRAIGASGPGVAHPTPIERFLASHPIAKTFVTTQSPPPVSYATAAYFGVNALKYTNAAGGASVVRYRFVPRAGEHFLAPADLATRGPNYLQEEIAQRVGKEPIVFDWFAQVAAKDDRIDDPSVAWPQTRQLVKLGTITATRQTDDAAAADRRTLFLPGQPHAGIEAADPMLTFRDRAYPISFGARQ